MFRIDQLGPIMAEADELMLAERMRYAKVYEAIETYLSQHTQGRGAVMLGGTLSVSLLLQKPRTHKDFQYELFTEDAFRHANDLANAIAEATTTEPTEVKLKTQIPRGKYLLYVDYRPMITVTSLPHRQQSAIDIMRPATAKTWTDHDILLIPPEVMLIDTYRLLYSPNHVGDWEIVVHDENQIFQHLRQRTVGSAQKTSLPPPDGGDGPSISRDDRYNILATLLEGYVAGNQNVLLVGEHALGLITGKPVDNLILEVVSATSGDDLSQITKLVVTALGRTVPVQGHTIDLPVLHDFRLQRTAIRVGAGDDAREVMYIYNSAEYDLLPFNTYLGQVDLLTGRQTPKPLALQIGNPFVQLRFLLVGYWMLTLIRRAGNIDEGYASQRTEKFISTLISFRTLLSPNQELTTISDLFLEQGNLLQVFQRNTVDYMGTLIPESIAQKLAAQGYDAYPEYFPHRYKREKGTYRLLGHK